MTWLVDDKEWMKSRRANWKVIKRKIDKLGFLENEEKKALKNYYLLGEEDENWPLTNMTGGALLELWLNPDKSEEQWNKIREKDKNHTNRFNYASNKEFMNINSHLNKYCLDAELSFFDGLEERLCKYFHLDRLLREDWPELEEDIFIKKAKEGLSLCRSFDNYLREESPNPYDITQYQVNRWFDAVKISFNPKYKIHGLDWMIESMCSVLNEPNTHHELVVNMARNLNSVINDSEFPEECREVIKKHKNKFGCPD